MTKLTLGKLAGIAEMCAGRDDIWVTTRGRIVDHFLASR